MGCQINYLLGNKVKIIYFYFIDYASAFDCVDSNKLWKILQEMGISNHLACLLRNLYTGQEAQPETLNELSVSICSTVNK